MSKKIYLSKSKIRGKGIFTAKNLKKEETAFVAKGKMTKFFVNSKKESLFGPNWMSISQDMWLDPANDNPLSFINHSCDPNLGVKGKVTFVALRNIKQGEELTIDYSIIELDPLWEMKCHCGSSHCRKIIRSIQYLPKKAYRQYLPFVPRYFMRVYNKIHNGH
ncbi:MAG: hypothetical protein A3A98_01395 [Candidatus Staskawiczbacteria bacterium RIFCSPLOWO2_01_FULL_40_39]|nr:MAG: hypothetical protein A3A98_01395 [Candidatus Staskawiczbacteria bacterium RIFCSPLOWO2_01_FULL_40_39]